MNAPLRPPGLCRTCERFDGCVYQRTAVHPVLFCEEFEGGLVATGRPAPAASSLTPAADRRPPVSTLGLCRDCRLVAQCTFPRAEGGVWHCEEYE